MDREAPARAAALAACLRAETFRFQGHGTRWRPRVLVSRPCTTLLVLHAEDLVTSAHFQTSNQKFQENRASRKYKSMQACVRPGMCVCVNVRAGDLWGLSSSASSLSLLARRMNGLLSGLPQPLLLLRLKLPFFFPVLPLFASELSYLATRSSSAATLSSSLPFH